jgi:hypothetical protein
MKNSPILLTAALVLAVALVSAPATQAQVIITQWNFTSAVGAGDNSPAPTTGNGTASMLGMTNSYTETNGAGGSTLGTGSVASGDIVSTTGIANSSLTLFTWRIRGVKGSGDTGTANNGWDLSAPQYSQGVEFDINTTGYSNLTFSFDWYSTTQGVRTLQEQYTTDGTDWININSPLQAVANDYFGTSSPTNTISFNGVSGVANDPDFGVRLVSAYDPSYSGAGSPSYTSANVTAGITQYNNNSGNWRFADITLEGTATVPEPGTTAAITGILALAAGLIYRRRHS